jgi:lipopolysaccharide export system protein LptA
MFIFLLITLTPFQADKVEIITEGKERIVHLMGNVVIEGGATKIMCAEAEISEASGWVKLFRDVRLIDRNGEVNAVSAIYYFNDDRGYLSDSVVIMTSNETISSDSLYYDGKMDSVEMYGNVAVEDRSNDLLVSGERGWYNLARDEGVLSGHPRLEIMRQDRSPLVVYAGSFKLLTNENRFYGYDAVQAIVDSVVVFCDTFSYDLGSEVGEMVRPVIQEKGNELKGAQGRFQLKNKEIEFVSVTQGESLYYTKDGSKNIVLGETIKISFKEGKATTILVDGQPRGTLSMKRVEEDAGD